MLPIMDRLEDSSKQERYKKDTNLKVYWQRLILLSILESHIREVDRSYQREGGREKKQRS